MRTAALLALVLGLAVSGAAAQRVPKPQGSAHSLSIVCLPATALCVKPRSSKR